MKKHNLLCAMLVACSISLSAQTSSPSLLAIHEDRVITSLEDKYWTASESLAKALAEKDVSSITYWAFRLEDGTYMYVSPAENYATLDGNMWKEAMDKIGEAKFNEIMGGFGETYLSHQDYMVVYHPDKSYKMDEMSEDDGYRQWFFNYIYEDKIEEYNKAADEWFKVSKEVNSPMGYGMYTNGFGLSGPLVVYMIWGKDQKDAIDKNNKTTELMGEKREQIWNKMKSCIYKTEMKRGWFFPVLSHMPAE